MATSNPFTDDPDKAEAWELGYLTGFEDPDGTDDFRPFSPDLLDVFTQGVDAGREDQIQASPADGGAWVPKSSLRDNEDVAEFVLHMGIEAIGHIGAKLFGKLALGLVGLVLMALEIPTDTPIKPLDDDFTETYNGPEDDSNVTFVAACPRTDHPMAAVGTTEEGYWTGTPQTDFGDALNETIKHGHAEAVVARCSMTDNTCGLVWVAQQPQQ
jgi:hypothetical protein